MLVRDSGGREGYIETEWVNINIWVCVLHSVRVHICAHAQMKALNFFHIETDDVK